MKCVVAEQFDAQVEVERRDQHARPERDPIECRAIAAGDRRQYTPGSRTSFADLLEFEHVDELLPPGSRGFRGCLSRPACRRSPAHGKLVLTAVRSSAASVVRPVVAIASRNSAWMISSSR